MINDQNEKTTERDDQQVKFRISTQEVNVNTAYIWLNGAALCGHSKSLWKKVK
jgi:hypothetical protein